MNDSDRYIGPNTPALPMDGTAAFPALDIKPQLLDLSENKQFQRQVTKACQTEITLLDEFWNVRIS